MGIFKKTIKYSKPSKDLDSKIKNLDEELKQTGIIDEQNDFEVFVVQEENELPKIYDKVEVEKKEESLYNWRETFAVEEIQEFQDIVEEVEYKTVRKVESYISESNRELIEIRDQVFQEISESTLLNLPEIKSKIEKVLEIYDQIQEGLLNEPPDTKNSDPLTPLDQKFVTVEELNKHYSLFINRIQEQLATVGGGGETKLKYLDDIVGIATNASAYDNKFLKYNHSLGKFEFASVGAGSQTLDDTLQLGNTSSLGMSVGVVTATYFVGNGSLLTNVPGSSNSGYANTAGIATYATTAGIATYAPTAGLSTYASTAGIATYATRSGIATYASTAGIATYTSNAGIATYAPTAGLSTYASTAGIATYATTAGIATYATSSGIATYASTAGVSTSVIGGIASVTQLTVSGVSTFSGTTLITNTTESTNKDTGALVVDGGVGIEKRLNVGGNLSSYGDYVNHGVNSSLQFDVGASVSPDVRIRNIYAGGRIRMDSVSGIDLEQYNSSSAYRARFDDTNVSLYSSGNLKLQTIGAGITVTGTTFTNQLSVSGVSTLGSVGSATTNLVVTGYAKINEIVIKGYNTGYGDNIIISQNPADAYFTGGQNVAIGANSFTKPGATGDTVAIGAYALNSVGNNNISNTYSGNTGVGAYAGQSCTAAGYNTLVGWSAGRDFTVANYNTFIGQQAGRYVTTGHSNTIIGSYDGNQNGLDIRTSGNNVVLSDGAGNIRFYANSSGNVGLGTTNPTDRLTVKGTTSLENLTVSGVSTFAGDGTNAYQYFTSTNAYLDFASTFNIRKSGVTYISVSGNTVALSENTTVNGAYYRIRTLSTGAEINGDLQLNNNSSLKVGTGGTVITTTYAGLVGINTTNPTSVLTVKGTTSLENLTVSGVSTLTDTRINSVSEKTTLVNGNTVSLVYNTGGGNIAICTNPSGDVSLSVTGIPTDSNFDNRSLTFSVIVSNTGTARSCTSLTLNGVSRTIKWFGGSLSAAISGVTTSSGYDIYNFTGINTVGSASTTTNYDVLGTVNGGYR